MNREAGRQKHPQWAEVICRRTYCGWMRVGFDHPKALRAKPFACGGEQCARGTLPPGTRVDQEAQNRANLIGVRNRLRIESVQQAPWRRIAPTHDAPISICEMSMHSPAIDALARQAPGFPLPCGSST
jgi:hypothetical protein